jgi:hypothetical protein
MQASCPMRRAGSARRRCPTTGTCQGLVSVWRCTSVCPFPVPCVCAKLFTALGGLEPQEAEAVPRDHREAEVDEASRCVETVRVRCVALCVQELGQG